MAQRSGLNSEGNRAALLDADLGRPARTNRPGPWSRRDRVHLIIWLMIAFTIPGGIVIAMRALSGSAASGFTVQNELATKGITSFCVTLATWIVSRLQKRSLDDYGIPARQVLGRRFWEGCAWGFAALSVLLTMLRVVGDFQIDSVALRGGGFLRYGLGWALAFLCVAISEELGFRGYPLFIAAGRFRFWPAAAALSVGFAAAHIPNPGENVIGILQVLGTGLLFCFMVRRTGNLWFALGYHATWDWAQTFFYGTADSGLAGVGHFLNTSTRGASWITGGSAGPEGSVLSLLLLVVTTLLVHFRFPVAVYPDRPV